MKKHSLFYYSCFLEAWCLREDGVRFIAHVCHAFPWDRCAQICVYSYNKIYKMTAKAVRLVRTYVKV